MSKKNIGKLRMSLSYREGEADVNHPDIVDIPFVLESRGTQDYIVSELITKVVLNTMLVIARARSDGDDEKFVAELVKLKEIYLPNSPKAKNV